MYSFILSIVYGRFLEWFFRPMFKFAEAFDPSVLLEPITKLIQGQMEGKADSKIARMDAATTKEGQLLQRLTQIEELEQRRQMANRKAQRERQIFNAKAQRERQIANRGFGLGRSGQQRSAGRFDQSMSDFARDTTGTPTEISRLQNLIRRQALPEQRRAMAQGRLALEQQGVRGPESALLQQMQGNQLQESLANRAQQVALEQALADRDTRARLAADQSLASLPGSMAGTVGSDLESANISDIADIEKFQGTITDTEKAKKKNKKKGGFEIGGTVGKHSEKIKAYAKAQAKKAKRWYDTLRGKNPD